jgi:hypothetical protein
MNRIKLKSIVSEIIKEMIEVNPVHQKINDKLMQIAKRGFDAEEEETYKGNVDKGNKLMDKVPQETIDAILKGTYKMKEGDSDMQRIDLSYTYPGQKFYSINVDNKKISDYKEANQIINSLTGLDLPETADYTDPEVWKIVDALKAKGIQAGSYEQSVD